MRNRSVTLAFARRRFPRRLHGDLDRLLEDERISIEDISGESAGAMNAVALAHGFVVGRRKAPASAGRFLGEHGAGAVRADSRRPAHARRRRFATGESPALKALVSLARFFSPYQLNPFDINPLRDIVSSRIDFERLRAESRIKLFIAATEVGDGSPAHLPRSGALPGRAPRLGVVRHAPGDRDRGAGLWTAGSPAALRSSR